MYDCKLGIIIAVTLLFYTSLRQCFYFFVIVARYVAINMFCFFSFFLYIIRASILKLWRWQFVQVCQWTLHLNLWPSRSFVHLVGEYPTLRLQTRDLHSRTFSAPKDVSSSSPLQRFSNVSHSLVGGDLGFEAGGLGFKSWYGNLFVYVC